MNTPKHPPDSGFSLVEVLAAIIIVTFFTTVSMQMLVVSAAFKAQAKKYTTATNLIQKDLEVVRNLAGNYSFPVVASGTPTPTVGATTLRLSSGNGLRTNDRIQFPGFPNVYTITNPNPIPTATPTITINPGIISPAPVAGTTVVVSNTVCSAGSASTGLANYLQQVTQGASYIDSSRTFSVTESGASVTYEAVVGANPATMTNTNQRLWLMRNDTNVNTPPYNTLQVRYLVVEDNNGSPNSSKVVARLSSEVIPNASFQCIQ
ncbi:type II secretion system protein [Anabaena sp. UHCC 0451]|uniref:type IV pilus modification PilV family protein n=1 Tax=Anabaena sp. UHCC 0451 TaxID=2055235 RepID=UPI002B213B2F|nr:type II secretion system protein [Anabaena sp. UHCC 0451]MEA5575423.1 type II secretion system protein [Anabaena sp. UHCC 0451]